MDVSGKYTDIVELMKMHPVCIFGTFTHARPLMCFFVRGGVLNTMKEVCILAELNT